MHVARKRLAVSTRLPWKKVYVSHARHLHSAHRHNTATDTDTYTVIYTQAGRRVRSRSAAAVASKVEALLLAVFLRHQVAVQWLHTVHTFCCFALERATTGFHSGPSSKSPVTLVNSTTVTGKVHVKAVEEENDVEAVSNDHCGIDGSRM